MSNIKTGDEVRIVRLEEGDEEYYQLGDTFIVSGISTTPKSGKMLWTWENARGLFESQVELVEKGVEDEKVNHPKHYNAGKIEVIDAIEEWNLGFNLGNVVKYVSRAEYKGNREQDLKKALWYLERELNK